MNNAIHSRYGCGTKSLDNKIYKFSLYAMMIGSMIAMSIGPLRACDLIRAVEKRQNEELNTTLHFSYHFICPTGV